MKLFHIGDLHIGKLVNEFSMIEDQEYILNKIIELVKVEKPEAIIMAGDIYDRSIPPAEAVNLLDEFINKLIVENNIMILAIAGNHDSGDRLNYGNKLFGSKGFYIEGRLSYEPKKIILNDKYGKINFYLVPYEPPVVVRKLYNNESIKTHNDAMSVIIDKIKENLDNEERNVLVTHAYVSGVYEQLKLGEGKKDLEESESEKPLSVGGSDIVSVELFNDFDYVALGHLHGQQRVSKDNIRYSGSILKYSFSEENHKKGVTIIELDKKGEFKYRHEEIKPLRDLRTIKGYLNDIIAESYLKDDNKEDYIQAILLDDGEIIDPMAKIRAVYHNTMIIKKEKIKNFEESVTSASENFRDMSELDLFKEYYDNIGTYEFTQEKENVVREVINEVFGKEE